MKNNRKSVPVVASNIYRLSAALRGERKSILEVAQQVYGFSQALYRFDASQFSQFNIDDKVIITHDTGEEYNNEKIVDEIAAHLLDKNKKDIRRYEKESQPDVYFSRDIGFVVLLLTTQVKKLDSFWFTFQIGKLKDNRVTIQFPINLNRDYSWYLGLVTTIIDFFDPLKVEVYPKFMATEEIPRTLAWITYYSKDSQLPTIPDWMEQENYADKGTIISLVKQDISTSKEVYQAYKQKLIEINTIQSEH